MRLVTVADGLNAPWSLCFLPDGRMLVSEQVGRLRLVQPDGTLGAPIGGLPDLYVFNQGGLLDVAVAPDFAQTQRIYFTFSEPGESFVGTAVARARLDLQARRLRDVEVIFRQRPKLPGNRHFGARIVFGPQGNIFATLGDRGERGRVQDLSNTLGSVVRVRPDGQIPADNPFVDQVGRVPALWSYGHRNPQGAAIHPRTGDLWIVEHGPTGGDELNLVKPGHNYGWPTVTHGVDRDGSPIGVGKHAPGMTPPIHTWTPSIAPSGLSFYTGDAFPKWRGDLLVGALAGRTLIRLQMEGAHVRAEERLLDGLDERIRDVVQGPRGRVYLLTDMPEAKLYRLEPVGR
ncbi:PQQ-dependent sugar dehydrogenase [Rhodovibrio salinarum]|uniref:PQQ-dependent sugar dehydrogenase n=1 Tax=Rhodovibrio salinarum TaxID=1087 RepID=UPI0019067D37|nr:PQQ-dependent sugar dehydrogenase [Rhodovibrio salinarum]